MNIKAFSEQTTYREVLRGASSFLEKKEQESRAAEWLIRERLDWTTTDLIRNFDTPMPIAEQKQFEHDLMQHVNGVPLQYIVGHEWFYDRKFRVTPDTLIPRPETEEWFDRLLRSLPEKPLSILDIGTGSGILAISQKLERPQDNVIATDISVSALDIAEKNAEELDADVQFIKGDLTNPVQGKHFDLIVSNPPYIGEDEWKMMDESVIAHEPHLALFAKEKGLAIYKRLAEELPHIVKRGGDIFLEIGYLQGHVVKELFAATFQEAQFEIWKDFSGHDRVLHIKTSVL